MVTAVSPQDQPEYSKFEHLMGLTPRQKEVLSLMAEGYDNASIAESMTIGGKSVENYVNSIYSELQIREMKGRHRRTLAVLIYLSGVRDPNVVSATIKFNKATTMLHMAQNQLHKGQAEHELARERLRQAIGDQE